MDDPANSREITTAGVRPGGAEVSPDGRSIVFSAFDARNQPAVSVCDLDACSSPKTLPFAATEVHWMPDGKALAYVDPKT